MTSSQKLWLQLVTSAAEVRLERVGPLLQQATETLLQAITDGRAEFTYLHLEARKERLKRASDHLDALLDREAFRHLKCSFQDLAATAREVTALDRACGYRGFRYWWMDQEPQARADGQLLQNVLPSSEQLIRAASEVENRFVELDRISAP